MSRNISEKNIQKSSEYYDKKTFSTKARTLILTAAVLFMVSSMCANGRVQADDKNSNEAENLIKQAKELIFQAENAEREGRREEALRLFEDAISFYEEARALDENVFDYLDYRQLAYCYKELDNYPQAIGTLENGIKMMGESGRTREEYHLHIYLANIYRHMGELDKSIDIYKSQGRVGREDSDWYLGLAGLYEQMGDTEAARAIYVSAFDALVFDLVLYRRCADFLIKNDYLDDAEEATYKAIVAFQDEPTYLPLLYKNLLTIYEKQGRSNETLDWIRLKIEESEKKAEEFWEQPTPEEKEFHRALTWFIVVALLVAAILVSIIALLIRRRLKKRKDAGKSSQEEGLS